MLNQNALGRALLGIPDCRTTVKPASSVAAANTGTACGLAGLRPERQATGYLLQEIRMDEEGRMQGLDEQGSGWVVMMPALWFCSRATMA